MKKKVTVLAIIVLVLVIVLQFLIIHPGIAMDNLYALGVPFAIPELLNIGNLLTGRDWPINIFSPPCTSIHADRALRSELTGNDRIVDYNDYNYISALRKQSFFYLLIWILVFFEILAWSNVKNIHGKLFLAAIALSVNIWAEILYVVFNCVNAVLSYGIAFVVFMIIYGRFATNSRVIS